MSRIEIVSASAGSGKTFRLAEILKQGLASGEVRPEAVLAVTFTNRAAAELETRARRALIEVGRVEDAHRLAAARIGTVHAVCGRLVAEFAFDLGLSPEQAVLDEAAAAAALARSASRVATADRQQRAAELEARMVGFKPEAARAAIIQAAQSNGLSAEDLLRCRDRSRQGMLEQLDEPAEEGKALEREVADALELFIGSTPEEDTTRKTADALNLARVVLSLLRSGGTVSWNQWAALAALEPGATSRGAAEPVRTAAGRLAGHPGLRRDLEQAIDLVFEGAAEALDVYGAYKRARGAVDFADQVALTLSLLDRPLVAERLAGELDLVLVDEFQDTSPIQIALFLKLAAIASRSVWVGDQKQAIFGFLGADPVLMEAALEATLGDGEPETLDWSWRSRPQLVRLTSDLFAPAFERAGIPSSRVRLEPAVEAEPAGLGPIVERWRVDSKNAAEDAQASAALVRQLLDDAEVRVRGRDGAARPVEPGDVAVLCRKNDTCFEVAAALGRFGVACVLPRGGLLATPEGQLVLSGLRRWADAHDALAAAVLARLAAYSSGEEWLEDALTHPRSEAFAAADIVRRLDRARARNSHAGVVDSFDTVVEATGAHSLCLEWGSSEQRLANLDALRMLAVRYLADRVSEGGGATVVGLVTWLEGLEGDADGQAVLAGRDAVTVSTWHRAKGLEWPVVVLFDLKARPGGSAFGVRVEQASEGFDIDDPLGGRWVRYWPDPFQPGRKKSFLYERLEKHPVTAAIRHAAGRERLRLLYVGWTRARDRVVLASRGRQQLASLLRWGPDDEGLAVNEPGPDGVEWAGHRIAVRVRDAAPVSLDQPEPEPGEGYVAAGPRQHAPAFVRPSAVDGTGRAGPAEVVGERVPLVGSSNVRAVGEAVHGFLAADRPSLDRGLRFEVARAALQRWGVGDNMDADHLLRSGDALRTWAEARWPTAVWRRELPVAQRLEDGSVVRGNADLVLELEHGFVLVDHKTFPGSAVQAEEHAAAFAGQLGAYAAAITAATNAPLVAAFIHLPVSGLVVPVEVVNPGRD